VRAEDFTGCVLAQSDKVEAFYCATLASVREQLALYLPELQTEEADGGGRDLETPREPEAQGGSRQRLADGSFAGSLQIPSPPPDEGDSRPPSRLRNWEEMAHGRDSLQRAVSSLYRELQHLRNYCILNYTGLVKILKKHDKRVTGAGRKRLAAKPLLMAHVNTLSFVAHDELKRIEAQIERGYAAAFCDANVQVARAELLVRRERGGSATQRGLALGLRLGVAAVLATWLFWDLVVDTRVLPLPSARKADLQYAVIFHLPVYRLSLAVASCFYLWAAACSVWKRARVNYLFLFELRDDEVLDPGAALALGTQQLTLCLLSLLLFSKCMLSELDLDASLFPVLLFLSMAFTLTTPHLGWWRRGYTASGFLRALAAFFSTPFSPVSLWSSFVGDIVTSLVRPLVDLAYSSCYVFSGEWLRRPDRQGSCHAAICGASPGNALLTALPLFFRFLQNLRVAHDTRRRVPALPNALKYAVALLVVLFGALHPAVSSGQRLRTSDYNPWVQYAWLAAYLGATLYAFLWDVAMDWRLVEMSQLACCRCGAGRLREERMVFRSHRAYYGAIAADLVLRFGWTATLAPGLITAVLEEQIPRYHHHHHAHAPPPASPDWLHETLQHATPASEFLAWALQTLVIGLELVRRCFWAVLRLEAEHLYNTEGFRRIDNVPMHFDRKAQEERPELEPKSRVQLLLELGSYLLLLAALATLSAVTRGLEGGSPGSPSP